MYDCGGDATEVRPKWFIPTDIGYELLSSMTLLFFLATEQAVTKKWALCLFYFIVKNLSGR